MFVSVRVLTHYDGCASEKDPAAHDGQSKTVASQISMFIQDVLPIVLEQDRLV
jgi:hypothetical protein